MPASERASPVLRCHPGQVLFDHLELQLLRGHDPRMGTGSPSRITQSFRFPAVYFLQPFHPACVFRGFENLVGVFDAVGAGCLRVFECVVDFEFLVLAEGKCVVGKDFDAFDVA